MSLSRADQSLFAEWWFSIDRGILVLTLVLMACGVIVSLAATPPAAERLGLDAFHFVNRHGVFLVIALPLFLAVSALSPRQIRWLSLTLAVIGLLLMLAAALQGIERNGAVRWLSAGGFSLQPSELVKPGFVVLSAWLLAEGVRRPDLPALPLSVLLLAIFAVALVYQPDIGQTLLIALVWSCLFFLAGYALRWVAILVSAVAGGAALAYAFTGHVRERVNAFLNPAESGNTQSEIALAAFREGGWFGRGPGEGMHKLNLPDGHTDYVFAVIAEEFGIISCLFLVVIYALLAWRGMVIRSGETNDFENLAKSGLTVLLVVQALTNMAVNVNLVPAKGVTLPLISYGGSSVISVAIMLGMILSLSRKRATLSLTQWTMFEGRRRGASSKEMKI